MAKLHHIEQNMYAFHCPGCGYDHAVRVEPFKTPPTWKWNGSLEKPTITPSIMVNRQAPDMLCHSFVTDGEIQFLQDCFHALRGKTVPLPEYGA